YIVQPLRRRGRLLRSPTAGRVGDLGLTVGPCYACSGCKLKKVSGEARGICRAPRQGQGSVCVEAFRPRNGVHVWAASIASLCKNGRRLVVSRTPDAWR